LQNTKDNPPCNTLFIGNLGETVVEEELRSLFSVQPGYKQMKVLRQERNTVCFIEFEVISYTTAMMLFLFPTKLEYARTNFIRNHQKTKININ